MNFVSPLSAKYLVWPGNRLDQVLVVSGPATTAALGLCLVRGRPKANAAHRLSIISLGLHPTQRIG